MSGGLKLRARDAEDLKVVSAMLQDSIIPICDLAWLAGERSFVMIANRFKWEGKRAEADGPTPDVDLPYERTNCAVRFDRVDRVSVRGLDLKDRAQMLNLLAVEAAENAVLLYFAGGASIRLTVGSLDCRLEDVGEPWPTELRPCHEGVDAAE
ncbi:DUF2948 family protein [Indioceanicola profundi]|uniref:DUF2948 family protein n=1 Tax=Indioceanicola profundi TaxID=2220096 RepID=UPI000E6AD26F|nr:DUF2948 family protein [Indioceanicola profundi]